MAYNVSDATFEQSTTTNGNFASDGTGQTNQFFLPSVFSKKVLNFFRKASVAEAITNTDYAGEIAAFGDSVKIIKEPEITVYQYERGADVTQTKHTHTHARAHLPIHACVHFMVKIRGLSRLC